MAMGNPILHIRVLPTATWATYSQGTRFRALDKSFNDRTHQHVYTFQMNRDVCHFEELSQPGKQS